MNLNPNLQCGPLECLLVSFSENRQPLWRRHIIPLSQTARIIFKSLKIVGHRSKKLPCFKLMRAVITACWEQSRPRSSRHSTMAFATAWLEQVGLSPWLDGSAVVPGRTDGHIETLGLSVFRLPFGPFWVFHLFLKFKSCKMDTKGL